MSELTIGNHLALITRTIKNAPPNMMFRELATNCIEAALFAINPMIKVMAFDPAIVGYDGFTDQKLCFWNNGPGLSPVNLRAASNLSCSINKSMGVDDNKGFGVKLVLPVNNLGVLFISCHDGSISMVRLYENTETGLYCREDFYECNADSPTGFIDVEDITHLSLLSTEESSELENTVTSEQYETYKKLPWDNSEDWTAVILLGNRYDQNTIKDPLDLAKTGKKEKNSWVSHELYLRYFSIPPNIKIQFEVGHGGQGINPYFESYFDVIQRIKQNELPEQVFDEIVEDSTMSGIKIWYVFENWDERSNRSLSFIKNKIAKLNGNGFSAIVHKNEMYDVLNGPNWIRESGRIGVPFGAKFLRTFVILPDSYPVTTDDYRQVIKYNDIDKTSVKLVDFSDIIRNNMPEWFKEKIKKYAISSTQSNENWQDIGQDLFNKLLIKSAGGPGNGGANSATKLQHYINNANSTNDTITVLDKKPRAQSSRNVYKNGGSGNKYNIQMAFPKVNVILTPEDLDNASTSSELHQRPAEYAQGGEIFINGLYPGIDIAAKELISNYAHYELSDVDIYNKIMEESIKICRNEMTLGIIHCISYAMALHSKKGFTTEDVDSAISSGSLMTHAERSLNNLSGCHQKLKLEVIKITEGIIE